VTSEIDPLPLFVYGTLRDETFAGNLLERPVRLDPARLLDFEILTLEGFPYPIVFAASHEVVEGGVIRGLTVDDYRRLDAYEGVGEGLYARVEASVVAGPEDGAEPEPAFVYVVTERTLRRHGAL